jgi:hypothetical protein
MVEERQRVAGSPSLANQRETPSGKPRASYAKWYRLETKAVNNHPLHEKIKHGTGKMIRLRPC